MPLRLDYKVRGRRPCTANEYTVAVCDTAGTLDIIQDVLLVLGLPSSATAQFNALTTWLDQLSSPGGILHGQPVSFTGHSLGSPLAAAAPSHCNRPVGLFPHFLTHQVRLAPVRYPKEDINTTNQHEQNELPTT